MKTKITVLLLLLLTVFYCAEKVGHSNVFDPDYDGDYGLDVLTMKVVDTLSVFTPYQISFAATGTDTFLSYTFYTSGLNLLDTSITKVRPADSLIELYFKSAYDGYVFVQGITPNNRIYADSFEVHVINPFELTVDSSTIGGGIDVEFRVINRAPSSYDTALDVVWYVNQTRYDSSKVSKVFTHHAELSDSFFVSAILKDKNNNSLMVQGKAIQVRGAKPQITDVLFPSVVTIGDTLTLVVKTTDADSTPSRIQILAGDSILYEDARYEPFAGERTIRMREAISVPDSEKITVIVRDSTGMMDQWAKVILVKRTTPKVIIPQKTLYAPLNKPFTIAVTMIRGDTLIWSSKRKGIDTSTVNAELVMKYTDTIVDTIIVLPKDQYGTIGEEDTIFVVPREYLYDLEIVSFPATVLAKRWNTWKVQAKKNEHVVDSSLVVYTWTTSPDKVWDSSRIENGSLSLFFEDAAQFTLKVSALIGSDSTYNVSSIITVRADKPQIIANPAEINTLINTDIKIALKAKDSNIDGQVVSVNYRIDTQTDNYIVTGDTLVTRFTKPGDKVLRIWAVDNDGFVSDTAAVLVHVAAVKPYFQKQQIDMTVYLKDNIRVSAVAFSGSTNDSVIMWKWDLNNDGIYDTSTKVDYFDISYSDTGKRVIGIWCANSQGDSSETTAVRNINVIAGEPVVDSVSLSTKFTYIKQPVALRVNAHDINGTVKGVTVNWGDTSKHIMITNGRSTIDTSITVTFDSAMTYRFTVQVSDEDSVKSQVFAVPESLVVDPGIPVIKDIKPDSVYINDDTVFTIRAEDNGQINGYAVSYDGSAFSSYSVDFTFRHTFTDTGVSYIWIKVKDNDNKESAVLKDSVVIKAGYPQIGSITLAGSENVYVLDTRKFVVTANDVNEQVRKMYINWNNGSVPVDSLIVNGKVVTDTFTHAFSVADTGERILKVWAVDNDGLRSSVKSDTVQVRLGRPVVKNILKDSTNVFINDPITYTLNIADTNGSIIKAYADWDNNSIADDSVSPSSATSAKFTHAFALEDTGLVNIHFWVRDDDGILSTKTNFVNTVLLGAPLIDSIGIDTCWVSDTNIYQIFGKDINGHINSFRVSFDNGTAWSAADSSKFTHAWDTTEAGPQKVITKVMDDDSVWSTDTFEIVVRLGRPVVKGTSFGDTIQIVKGTVYDTMFYKYTGGNTTMQIDTVDTNGSIVEFYWDIDANGTVNATTTTTTWVQGLLAEQPRIVKVWAKDDDSIASMPYSFYIFPDSPPEIPLQIAETKIGTDSIRLTWSGSDVKDGDALQFKILCDKSTTPTTIVKDFGVCEKNGSDFYATVKISSTGRYYWKVIARDARGSESVSASVGVFDF